MSLLQIVFFVFIAAQTTPPLPGAVGSSAPPPFFAVMPWNSLHGWGPESVERGEGLESIAQCGFNVAGFVEARDLPACEALGLKAFIGPAPGARLRPAQWAERAPEEIDAEVCNLVGDTTNRPSVLGYYIADEPRAGHFAGLARAATSS